MANNQKEISLRFNPGTGDITISGLGGSDTKPTRVKKENTAAEPTQRVEAVKPTEKQDVLAVPTSLTGKDKEMAERMASIRFMQEVEATGNQISAEITQQADGIIAETDKKVARIEQSLKPGKREQGRLGRLITAYEEENAKLGAARGRLTAALTDLRKNGESEETGIQLPAFIQTRMVERGETIRPVKLDGGKGRESAVRVEVVGADGNVKGRFFRANTNVVPAPVEEESVEGPTGQPLIDVTLDQGRLGLRLKVTKR